MLICTRVLICTRGLICSTFVGGANWVEQISTRVQICPYVQIAHMNATCYHICTMGAQWLSGRALDSRPKGRGFEPHRRHCVVSLSKNIYLSLVLVQPRKIRPYITERLLMGRKESNQTNKTYVQFDFRF